MSHEGTGDSFAYEVIVSQKMASHIKAIHFRALQTGKGNQVLKAIQTIYQNLRFHPKEFGEPLYRLPAAHLQVRVGVVHPISVGYGVHDQLAMVFIRNLRNLLET